MPELPDYIKGIINLRGKIIPVMDVRTKFKKPSQDYDYRTCVIIVDIKNLSIGLIVDSVTEVISIHEENITKLIEIGRSSSHYIKGIGKVGNDVKLILDCEKLIDEDEIEELNEVELN